MFVAFSSSREKKYKTAKKKNSWEVLHFPLGTKWNVLRRVSDSRCLSRHSA